MLNTTQVISYAALIVYVTLRSVTAFAVTAPNPAAAPASQPLIQLVVSSQKDIAIRLEARQAPLGQIMKEIAAKTGAVIHYSVLPEAPVTATCAGANIWQVMDCLVAKQVGLVANKPEPGKPAEFWVLSSSVGSCQAMTIESKALPAEPVIEAAQTEPTQPNKEHSDALLAGFKDAKTVEERRNALGYFAMGADINDPNIRKALDDALEDKNPAIRTQAMSSLVSLDKNNANAIIGRALHDNDSAVRISAIESAADNREMLEQATADSDNSVSSYAASKLAALLRSQERRGQQ